MLTDSERLKIAVLARGISLTPEAARSLSERRDAERITDYPTTSGLTLVFEDGNYVNAMVEPWGHVEPAARLDVVAGDAGARYVLADGSARARSVTVLRRPSFVADGASTLRGVMSHADRVRVSPIIGCAYSCGFCDWHHNQYQVMDVEGLLESTRRALADEALPPRHAMISGGTPRPEDRAALDRIYERLIREIPVPVDVMLAPRREDPGVVDRLHSWGASGVSINVEIFDEPTAPACMPQKARTGLDLFERDLVRAVELFGRKGQVRSLLIVGVEDLESTLAGVEFIASLGADPVLSPFVPAGGTPLAHVDPPSEHLLEQVYLGASEIAARHGVALGPRCVPCQHNTVAFARDGSAVREIAS